jgi:alpha-mannosidase
VGWLSRADLALRRGPAGPPFATPGAQVPGPHTAEFSLRWARAGAADALAHAHRFAYAPCAFPAIGAADAPLRDGARLLEVDDPAVLVSAIEPRRDGAAIARIWNASEEARAPEVRFPAGVRDVGAVDLAERPDPRGALETTGVGSVRVRLRPWEIRTLRGTR